MNPLEEAITPQVRVVQIILGALISGVLVFGTVVTTILKDGRGKENVQQADDAQMAELAEEGLQEAGLEEPAPVLQYVGYGFAAMAISLFAVIGPLARKQALSQVPTPLEENLAQTMGAFVTGKIISAAILEGATFFNLIAYMLEGAIGNLAVAVVLAIGIASLFPTVSSAANWLTDAIRARTESDSYKAL